jgi:hypothetical protein
MRRARTPKVLGPCATSGRGTSGRAAASERRVWGRGPTVRRVRRGAGAPGALAGATSLRGDEVTSTGTVEMEKLQKFE